MWIVWIAIGLLIGWQFPQPKWAQDLQAGIVRGFKRKMGWE